jgi:hypothetical protein
LDLAAVFFGTPRSIDQKGGSDQGKKFNAKPPSRKETQRAQGKL